MWDIGGSNIMDTKKRLELLRLDNKFKNIKGIKSYRIATLDELTEIEKSTLNDMSNSSSNADDKVLLTIDYPKRILWTIEKLRNILAYDSEVIFVVDYSLVFLFLSDIEDFLHNYFDIRECFSIYCLNREIEKCVIVMQTEYYLEYSEKFICNNVSSE